MTLPNCTPDTIALAMRVADCNAFAQHGDPSANAGGCAWCGKRLPLFSARGEEFAKSVNATHGAYGDGAFCTLRCGFAFALQMVQNGRALKSAKKGTT